MELSEKLNEKIYVCEREVFDQYLSISRLESCVTMSQPNARIFLTRNFVNSDIKLDSGDVVMKLQLSAMFWTNWSGGNFVLETHKNSFRVCYATHNSYNEIRDFLLFMKPATVHLNVEPKDSNELQEMLSLLDKIQKEYQPSAVIEEIVEPKKFSFNKIRSRRPVRAMSPPKKSTKCSPKSHDF
jgi:DNA repair metallo-beta-lactamase